MTWSKPKNLEAEQVRCMLGDEGHVWISWLDRLSPAVRERLRNASFNICPACLIQTVGHGEPDAAYFRQIEAWEKEDRIRLGRWASLADRLPARAGDPIRKGE
jgi:hypothetical protein